MAFATASIAAAVDDCGLACLHQPTATTSWLVSGLGTTGLD